MERFSRYDNFMTDEALSRLQNFFQENVPWTFGWQSSRATVSYGHWNHDFLKMGYKNQENCEYLLADNPTLAPLCELWNKLKEEKLPGHALVRCYANAHTFGIEGYPHVDSRTPGNYTTIFYINPIWKPEWAGETVFLNDAGDIFQAVLPKPGRMIVFDGNVMHAARAVARICPALRITLMFKTCAPGAQIDQA